MNKFSIDVTKITPDQAKTALAFLVGSLAATTMDRKAAEWAAKQVKAAVEYAKEGK